MGVGSELHDSQLPTPHSQLLIVCKHRQKYLDTKIDDIIKENRDIFGETYSYIEKQGKEIPSLKLDDLPHNTDFEILLTKILTYSYYLGYTKKSNKLVKNVVPISDWQTPNSQLPTSLLICHMMKLMNILIALLR